jgi:hypothetical protein
MPVLLVRRLAVACCLRQAILNTQLLSPSMNLDGHQAIRAKRPELIAWVAKVEVSKLALS